MCGKYGFVVAVIDSPFHVSRHMNKSDSSFIQKEFQEMWADGEELITQMALDWKLALDALCELPEVDSRYVGYFGLSMGTAYGLEVVAKDLRIGVAVFGNWGIQQHHHGRLMTATRRINCPLEFYSYEKALNLPAQKELFENFRSKEKKWHALPKEDFYRNDSQIEGIKDFFVLHLLDRYLY
jgi:hypothetical protein